MADTDVRALVVELLREYETSPYGDVCLNSERIAAKIATAVREAGLVVVAAKDAKTLIAIADKYREMCERVARDVASWRFAEHVETLGRGWEAARAALPVTEETRKDADEAVCGPCGKETGELFIDPEAPRARRCRECEIERTGHDPDKYPAVIRARSLIRARRAASEEKPENPR